jgi:hypothetical protein
MREFCEEPCSFKKDCDILNAAKYMVAVFGNQHHGNYKKRKGFKLATINALKKYCIYKDEEEAD